jgi:hypothetical protein
MVALDIRRFVNAAKGKLAEAALETVQDIAEQVVVRSPFKTGFLMSSWYAQINTKAGAPFAGAATGDRSGSVALNRITATLLDYSLGDVIYIQNGTAYAARLEFGFVGEDSAGRSYNQAPRAWVRGVIAEAPAIALAAAARVAAGKGGGDRPGGGGRLPDKGYVTP